MSCDIIITVIVRFKNQICKTSFKAIMTFATYGQCVVLPGGL